MTGNPPEIDTDSANHLWEYDEEEKEYRFPPYTARQKEVMRIINEAKPESTTIIGYGGGMGGGKTHLDVRAALMLATSFPGNRGLVGRQELKTLKTTTEEEFYNICPPEFIAKRNDTEQWVQLRMPHWPAGLTSKIFFKNLENWKGLGSEEYGFVIIDEGSEVSLEAALMLFTRLRRKLPRAAEKLCYWLCKVCGGWDSKRTGQCRFHGNTISKTGHRFIFLTTFNPWPSWCVDWFYGQEYPEQLNNPDIPVSIHFVRALVKDNPHVPEGYEATQRALLSGTPGLAARMLDGRFDLFPGMVYEIFDKEKHAWIASEFPRFRRLVGGLDFGGESEYSDETAGIVGGITDTGRLIRLAVFKEKGADVDRRHMEWMVGMQKYFGDPIRLKIQWCADKTQSRGIAMMRRSGFAIRASTGGNDSVEAGVKAVARRMVFDAAGLPGSYYWPKGPGMQHYLREVQRYRRDQSTLEIVRGQDDHVMDADRYMEEMVDRYLGDPGNLFPNALPGVR